MGASTQVMQGRPYIFVVKMEASPSLPNNKTYNFHAKFGEEPPELAGNSRVVRRLRVPRLFSNIEPLLETLENGSVGFIEYQLARKTAYSSAVYPKKHAPTISALGFFFELLSTHDLRKNGIEAISTSQFPSGLRVSRLKYANLPFNRPTDARTWELGLSSAIRKKIERARRFI
jgi:hypothetical protein